MTTEKYNEYLNKYNANWKEARPSFFECGVDMMSILGAWSAIGLKTNSYYKDNAYIVDLLDKDGNVVGYFKSVPGGMYWEYPELIMQLKKYEKERGLL